VVAACSAEVGAREVPVDAAVAAALAAVVEDLAEAVASEEAAGSKEKGFGITPKPFLLSLPFLFP